MGKLLAALLLSLICSPTFATEVCDNTGCFNLEKRLAEVRAIPGIEESQKDKFIVLSDKKTMNLYIFTTEGAQVYPSYIERKITKRDGAFYIETIGYTGARKELFEPWFAQYKELDKKVLQQVKGNCKSGCKTE